MREENYQRVITFKAFAREKQRGKFLVQRAPRVNLCNDLVLALATWLIPHDVFALKQILAQQNLYNNYVTSRVRTFCEIKNSRVCTYNILSFLFLHYLFRRTRPCYPTTLVLLRVHDVTSIFP